MEIIDHAIARFVLKANLNWAEIHLLLDWILPESIVKYDDGTNFAFTSGSFCYSCKRSKTYGQGILISCNNCCEELNNMSTIEKDKYRLMFNYAQKLFLSRPIPNQIEIMKVLHETSHNKPLRMRASEII